MNSFFKILSSDQWEDAKLTGLISRSEADHEDGCVHVCEFDDLNKVCASSCMPQDHPVALEFAPDSYGEELTWNDPTKEMPWRDGRLNIDHLHADLVLNIYSFGHQQTNDGIVYILQGEE